MAHNEAAGIGAFLAGLARQTVFSEPDIDFHAWIVANGCSDDTVAVATKAMVTMPAEIAERISLVERAEGGKSRSMNHFLRHLTRPEADLVAFMDADIDLVQTDTLQRMAQAMQKRPGLRVYVSHPVPDVVHYGLEVGPFARLIAAGAGGAVDMSKVICGQLFMLRGEFARSLGLPADLPVDDGYIRIMALTDYLSKPENLDLIDGDPDIFHVFVTEGGTTVWSVLQHNIRIKVGTAINFALIQKFQREQRGAEGTSAVLREAGETDGWLTQVMREETPRLPYGFVPFRFGTRRLVHAWKTRVWRQGLKRMVLAVAGTGLDFVSWAGASFRMMVNRGVGHW